MREFRTFTNEAVNSPSNFVLWSKSSSVYTNRRTTVRDGVLQAMALASRTTGHVLGLGLGKHVLGLGHFRLMCLVLCTLY